jgi:ElaB/YqjD/DUF883 family membrane-anchored ribosome-binding protein
MDMSKAHPGDAPAATSDSTDPATQLAALQAELARLQAALAELGQASGARLQEGLSDGAAALRAQAGEEMAAAAQQLEQSLGRATDLARRNPAAALAVAAGAGLILGLLLGRR